MPKWGRLVSQEGPWTVVILSKSTIITPGPHKWGPRLPASSCSSLQTPPVKPSPCVCLQEKCLCSLTAYTGGKIAFGWGGGGVNLLWAEGSCACQRQAKLGGSRAMLSRKILKFYASSPAFYVNSRGGGDWSFQCHCWLCAVSNFPGF